MKDISKKDDEVIYRACNTIRALMTVSSAASGIKNPGNGFGDIAEKTGKGSRINELVQSRDWKNLFLNQDWLSILEGAQNLNFLQNGIYKEHLVIIAKFFPNETARYIFAEIL